MSRLPSHIRKGVTIQAARKAVLRANYDEPMKVAPLIRLDIEAEGHDTNGNRIAHFVCRLTWPSRTVGPVFMIVQSGRNRPQFGFGTVHEAALLALEKLGWKVDVSKARQTTVCHYLPVTNWFEEEIKNG